ncbi:MAG: HEPN domain-containing protein [bacterium]
MTDKVKYWIELSDYDLDTASAMLSTGRYLYVGFMCHQAIEKALKAYFVSSSSDSAPYSHSLAYLAKKALVFDLLDHRFQEFIDVLEPLNIEARYPSHKERLMESLTRTRCENILSGTKELQQWIKERL